MPPAPNDLLVTFDNQFFDQIHQILNPSSGYALLINLPVIFCNSAGISLAGNTKSTQPVALARKGMLLTSAVAS